MNYLFIVQWFLVLNHIQINVLNIHHPRVGEPQNYEVSWLLFLVFMKYLWSRMSGTCPNALSMGALKHSERVWKSRPHPSEWQQWNINLEAAVTQTHVISMIKYDRISSQNSFSSRVMSSRLLRPVIIKIPSDPDSAEQRIELFVICRDQITEPSSVRPELINELSAV